MNNPQSNMKGNDQRVAEGLEAISEAIEYIQSIEAKNKKLVEALVWSKACLYDYMQLAKLKGIETIPVMMAIDRALAHIDSNKEGEGK